ncbi:SNF2-related protein [Desulfobacula sp.]|uniref:SNF2-related protein n=1 Tax=Desulfobacula sp. TaxID=2593537 RepID=UPI0026165A30|nr:SNF2-related protein [Desulfobacula sp.]
MHPLISGQRWLSEAEPELGLGTLIAVNDRMISVRFDSSDCVRQYTRQSAPLKRVIFKSGDEIQLKNNARLTIESVTESDGLLYYSGENTIVCEKDLPDTLSFSMPQDRLFAGITDTNKLFDLRYQVLTARAGYDASPVKGFIGGQVELIPHQFFIADTVTKRYIPRVLLSDETGLGKTIEACLVLHKLLATHRAERMLIVVPESLVHQWFIELYRKFNLSFMILNEAYCSSLEQKISKINPFLEHQLGIVSMDFLKTKKRQLQIIAAGWDMVVVDEAHHITDEKTTYGFIKTLAQKTFGLMLLTATPEQMGVKNHFHHLQLLDPERYFDFNTYLDETNQYKKTLYTIKKLIKKGNHTDQILDSYGPGRVIFRNKRTVIKGFPKRVAHLYPLGATADQVKAANQEFFGRKETKGYALAHDPRISCLIDLLKTPHKILVICSSKNKVDAIDKAIASHMSLGVAKFDETMTLLQRDRNAAWFSRKNGARLLICSEIGSEGRNFQFVHHLFLFDLPQNPELLEQRIGRLDRIGQKHTIQIHVPFIRGSVHEILARWYMDGLNLFRKNINGAHLIYTHFEHTLQDLFRQSKEAMAIEAPLLENLIAETAAYCITVDNTLAQGKNILLEMNSFKPEIAHQLIDRISRAEQNAEIDLLLIRVLDHYGIEADFIDQTLFKLNSSEMTDEKFPALTHLSGTMTFNRETAIARDDIDFFSWDHPFVQQTFDFFITTGTGSCATALLKGQRCPGIWLETVFVLECVAPARLNIERYLMPEPIRIVVDHNKNDITGTSAVTALSKKLTPDQNAWFKDMDQVRKHLIPSMIEKSMSIAGAHSERMMKKGKAHIKEVLGQEITRLTELKKINPDIKEKEITLAHTRMRSLLDHLSSARLRMDALRLIRVK